MTSLFTCPQVIQLSGVDAARFAQAQFCNDVAALAVGQSQLNAWLNPQGRVRRLFHLIRADESRFLLLLRGGDAGSVLAPLRQFVMRLKVEVSALQEWSLGPCDQQRAAAPEHYRAELPDGRAFELLPPGSVATPEWDEAAVRAWMLCDIAAGLPWLPESAIEQVLPPWIDLHRLGALNYKKGCYPGQEIVARLHFRGGGDKRRLVRVGAPTAAALSGTLRDASGGEAGLLLQGCADAAGRWHGLAVVRRELASVDTPLQTESMAQLEVVAPTWTDASAIQSVESVAPASG